MVTIKDVARESGFSVSTVSRALADSELIPKHSKIKIKSVAEKLGYIPNLTAKSLKNNKFYNFGVITFAGEELGFSHNLFSGILNNFINEMGKNKYDVTVLSKHLVDSGEDLVAYCKSRNLNGVFMLSGDFSNKEMKKLQSSDIPTVVVDGFKNDESDNSYYVSSNNKQVMKELTSLAIQKGHKKIVYVHGEDIYVTRERIAGFREAIEDAGMEFKPDMLVSGHYYDMSYVSEVIDGILTKEVVPTCIFMPDDFCAIKAYDVLHERGIRIPEDISIAGFDGLEYVKHIYPKMATVIQNVAELGKTCAKIMISIINGEGPQHLTLIGADIYNGESIRTIK